MQTNGCVQKRCEAERRNSVDYINSMNKESINLLDRVRETIRLNKYSDKQDGYRRVERGIGIE